jgi:hypothetical protein
MADAKFSALTLLSSFAANDLIPLVDTSDTSFGTSGSNKIAYLSNIANFITGGLTGAFYPRTSNPSSYLVASDLSAYATQSYVGANFYPLASNPLSYVTATASGLLTGAFYPRSSNPSSYLVAADLATYASQTYVNNVSGVLRTDLTTIVGWTGSTTGLYYPRSSNPSNYLTGIIAGTNITVTNHSNGSFTINSTASGSASTGELTGAFYPRVDNPANYVSSTSGTVTVQGGGTILNGQLLIGSTGDNAFLQGGITAGSGISIISGSGSLTIHATATGIGAGDVSAAAVFSNDNRVIRSDGTAKGVQASTVTLDDNGIFAGSKTRFSAALASDDTWEGNSIFGLNAFATIAQWEAVYLNTSSAWALADANGVATYPARGLAAAAYSSGNAAEVVIRGTVRNDAWSWTIGAPLYLSTTPGALTQTAPATSGDQIQVVGYALTADIAYVDFNGEYITKS